MKTVEPSDSSSSARLVLDTNVVLSALVFPQGRLAALRDAWQRKACQPLASNASIAELIRALTYPKFRLSTTEQQELVADYVPYCTCIRMPARAPATPACRDPRDVPFLELALVGKAHYLLTGDCDLLALAGAFRCPIVTAEYWLKSVDR